MKYLVWSPALCKGGESVWSLGKAHVSRSCSPWWSESEARLRNRKKLLAVLSVENNADWTRSEHTTRGKGRT